MIGSYYCSLPEGVQLPSMTISHKWFFHRWKIQMPSIGLACSINGTIPHAYMNESFTAILEQISAGSVEVLIILHSLEGVHNKATPS